VLLAAAQSPATPDQASLQSVFYRDPSEYYSLTSEYSVAVEHEAHPAVGRPSGGHQALGLLLA
jgi:hypothetical protein